MAHASGPSCHSILAAMASPTQRQVWSMLHAANVCKTILPQPAREVGSKGWNLSITEKHKQTIMVKRQSRLRITETAETQTKDDDDAAGCNALRVYRKGYGRYMVWFSSAPLKGQEVSISTTSKDLLVIGPGVLGKLVAGLWMKNFPGCYVAGQTVTTNHHEELQSLGIKPLLKSNLNEQQFPFVIFCAPPSGSSDYAGELSLAAQQWNGEGVLLFTSSSAVYDCMDNGNCDEETPILPLGKSPRGDVLLRAEQEVLQVGGTVVRLAGLYSKERGPHAYWAKKGIVDARPDHILNLIHYEDAASLCVTILKKGFQKEVFMGCDNHPLSRQEVMDIVNESGKFEDKFEAFTGKVGPLGKKMNCKHTCVKTGWQPKYASFAEFIKNLA